MKIFSFIFLLLSVASLAGAESNAVGNRCFLPPITGNCLAAIYSWYYNAGKKTCEQFMYGGCGGNANRFSTRYECEDSCANSEPTTTEFHLIVE